MIKLFPIHKQLYTSIAALIITAALIAVSIVISIGWVY